MRRMRSVVLAAITAVWLAATALMAVPPPAVPEARDRVRLKSDNKVEGTLRTHADADDLAALDAQLLSKTLSKAELYYIRYLDLHNIPPSNRQNYYDIISVILNGFIKERNAIVTPAWGGPDNTMIRVNLFDYRIDPKAWDKLGEQDPYFHQIILKQDVVTKEVQTEELEWYKTGLYYGSDINKPEWKQRYKTKQVVETSKPVRKQVAAGWLHKDPAGELGVLLQTNFPILRADWFITNVTLEPNYSNFLGIKTLDDLKKFGGFDRRTAPEAQPRRRIAVRADVISNAFFFQS